MKLRNEINDQIVLGIEHRKKALLINLNFILIQQHIWDPVVNWKNSACFGTN
jgi:hypothetical protein